MGSVTRRIWGLLMGSFSSHRTHLIYYHQYVMLMFTVYFPVYLPRNQSDCYIKDLRLSGLMSTCRGKRPYNILSVCIACTYEYKYSQPFVWSLPTSIYSP